MSIVLFSFREFIFIYREDRHMIGSTIRKGVRNMQSLGSRLTNLRESEGWSKTYVANRLNLNLSTYANYEYGNREPDFETIGKLADLFNVSADYLLGRGGHTEAGPSLSKNQRLVAYSIDPDISDEERKDIIEMVKLAMKHRRRA